MPVRAEQACLIMPSATENAGIYEINCGNSSVGRAQPCQGWGREFEPRFPLQGRSNGGIGRHEGLKILWPVMAVRVQVPLRVPSKDSCESMIYRSLFFFTNIYIASYFIVVFLPFNAVLHSLCKPMCKPEIKIKSNSLLQIRTVQ